MYVRDGGECVSEQPVALSQGASSGCGGYWAGCQDVLLLRRDLRGANRSMTEFGECGDVRNP